MTPPAIALDLGGVLLSDGTKTAFHRFEREFGLREDVGRALWQSRLRVPAEIGLISEDDVWQGFQSAVPLRVSCEAIRNAFLSEFRPIQYGVDALIRLHRDGARVGLATNHVSSWLAVWREKYAWFSLLDPVCCSSTLRCRKPEVAFFQAVRAAFGSDPLRFVDDDPVNVKGGRLAGLDAFLAQGDWLSAVADASTRTEEK